MKFCSISDLHIKSAKDAPSKLLELFVNSNQVKEADRVYFLGDIFDFMVGNRKQYLEKYDFFFKTILDLINQKKKVIYIEGNHDFHLEKIMNGFAKDNRLTIDQFEHSKNAIVEEINGKKFFFTHGHEIDENSSYQKWKEIYSSKPFKFFVDHLLPYYFVERLGNKASNDSKKRGVKSFIYEKTQEMYRHGAKVLIEKEKIDYLITGHTHIEENLEIENAHYANNGFPQATNKFIYFNGRTTELVSL